MVKKDFTDFITFVTGWGERWIHVGHIRKTKELKLRTFAVNGFNYQYKPNWCYELPRWKPVGWSWFNAKRLFHSLQNAYRRKRVGLLLYSEPCDHECKICGHKKACIVPPDGIEPYHISKVHQPSGRYLDDPRRKASPIQGQPDLIEVLTPASLKDYIDNRFYADTFGTFKFGEIKAVASKYWFVALIGVIVFVIVILYLTGNIRI